MKKEEVLKNLFVKNLRYYEHRALPILLVSCDFNAIDFTVSLFKQLGISCPECILQSVSKRQTEFLAGRYVAREALTKIGLRGEDDLEIKIGKHREPIWPEGIIGSITHSSSKAICLLAKTRDADSLGIDVEKIISPDKVNDIASIVCIESEIDLVTSNGFDMSRALTLIFSAKESIFKALYAKVGKFFDFDIAILCSVNTQNQMMEFNIERAFAVKNNLKLTYQVFYSYDSVQVITLLIEPKQDCLSQLLIV
ncbi:4'-phosphopantetheinyl transferase family protein [Pleionea sediminis]|uniref:4'-phosphopantetheinyl transferase family protein n=1 Tax=Pleionea sediminis TaxID=2569479 RepID=UPI0013DE4BD2|nr:4'-phosphopantetheinyl transferase superfamily protein [Pleionea sediminis]